MEIHRSGGGPIVVGVDGSRFSREALRWALAEATLRDCAVRALMVVHAPPVVAAGPPAGTGLGAMLPEEPAQDRLSLLETTVHDVLAGHDDPRLTTELLRGGPPEVLCDESRNAQLLVLGSRGHGQLFDAVLGSVSQYCVRHASCPVVVIPPQLARAAEGIELARLVDRST
jgi:nucleotide-binding universal stress UspA family protein